MSANTIALMGLLNLLVKSTLLLAIAALVAWRLRGASAASRHLVWQAAFGGLLLLPLLPFCLPAVNVPVLPPADVRPVTSPTPLVVWLTPTPAPPPPMVETVAPEVSTVPERFQYVPPVVAPLPSDAPVSAAPQAVALPSVNWFGGVWLIGILAAALPILAAGWKVRRLARSAQGITDGPLYDALELTASMLGVGVPVRLRIGSPMLPAPPMTWGWRRPTILLPASALYWPAERLRAVLLHEMAHIRRSDWLMTLLAHLVCLLYWFHPLVWLAARQLRRESERACDDCVLLAGVPAKVYAHSLLEVVRTMKPLQTRNNPASLSAVSSEPLESRLRAILDLSRSRREPPRRKRRLALTGAALSLTLLTMLHLGVRAQQTPPATPTAPEAPATPTAPVAPATPEAPLAPTAPVQPALAPTATPEAPAPPTTTEAPAQPAPEALAQVTPPRPQDNEAAALRREIEALRRELKAQRAEMDAMRKQLQRGRIGRGASQTEEMNASRRAEIELERAAQELQASAEQRQTTMQELQRRQADAQNKRGQTPRADMDAARVKLITAQAQLAARLAQMDAQAQLAARLAQMDAQKQAALESVAADLQSRSAQGRAEMMAAQAQLNATQATLRASEVGRDQAEAKYKAGVTSQAELENAKARLANAQAQLEAARVQVQAAQEQTRRFQDLALQARAKADVLKAQQKANQKTRKAGKRVGDANTEGAKTGLITQQGGFGVFGNAASEDVRNANVTAINGMIVKVNCGAKEGVRVGDILRVLRTGGGGVFSAGTMRVARVFADDLEARMEEAGADVKQNDPVYVINRTGTPFSVMLNYF